MSKMVTRLYVYGKNNVSIENFPTDKYHTFGKKYIECYDYFTKNKNYLPGTLLACFLFVYFFEVVMMIILNLVLHTLVY